MLSEFMYVKYFPCRTKQPKNFLGIPKVTYTYDIVVQKRRTTKIEFTRIILDILLDVVLSTR